MHCEQVKLKDKTYENKLVFFFQLEGPAQLDRLNYQQNSQELLHSLETNLSRLLRQKSEDSLNKFEEYQIKLKQYQLIPEEIEWEMLSASAFVTSVSSCTGKYSREDLHFIM